MIPSTLSMTEHQHATVPARTICHHYSVSNQTHFSLTLYTHHGATILIACCSTRPKLTALSFSRATHAPSHRRSSVPMLLWELRSTSYNDWLAMQRVSDLTHTVARYSRCLPCSFSVSFPTTAHALASGSVLALRA